MASHTNIATSGSGTPLPGVQVRVYDNAGVQVGAATTNAQGSFTIHNLVHGAYNVRLYGEDFTSNHWYTFNVVEGESAPILFENTPTLAVDEVTAEAVVGGSHDQNTQARFTLQNLDLTQGALSSIKILWKPDYLNNYGNFFDFSYSLSLGNITNNGQTATYYGTLPMSESSVSKFDFKAQFYNGLGIPAVQPNGNLIEPTDTNVTFNGVPDIQEYLEVEKLKASDNFGNSLGESGVLTGDQVSLTWVDLKKLSRSTFNSTYGSYWTTQDAFGNNINVTFDMSRNIESYGVFIFVANSTSITAPTFERPGLNDGESEPNGDWHFMGDFTTTDISITLPESAKVGVWVGFRQNIGDSTAKTDLD